MENRRNFLAKTVEWASTIPLIGLIYSNFMSRTNYYEIDHSRTLTQRVGEYPSTTGLIGIHKNLQNSLENLYSKYESAYYVRHTRLVPHTTHNGKTSVTTLRSETYYVWEEPKSVPDHTVIERWRENQDDLVTKLERLTKRATTNIEKLTELEIRRQQTNKGSEGLVSLAIYSPQIAALLYYEEAIAKMSHSDTNIPASQIIEENDTSQQITRRSFFKVGAALAGALVSYPIVKKNREKREKGRSILEGEIEDIKRIAESSESEAFNGYFGITPSEMINSYQEQMRVSGNALEKGVKEKEVRLAFNQYIDASSKSIAALKELLGKRVPKEIGDLSKSAIISQRLDDKSTSEHRAVYTGIGLTGLAVAGAITVTLLPLELGDEYFANKFEKK